MVSDWLLGVEEHKKKRQRSQSHPALSPIPTDPSNLSEVVDALRALPCTVIKTVYDRLTLFEDSIKLLPRLDGTFHKISTHVSSRGVTKTCQWCRYKWDKLNIRPKSSKRQQRAHLKCDVCRVLSGLTCGLELEQSDSSHRKPVIF